MPSAAGIQPLPPPTAPGFAIRPAEAQLRVGWWHDLARIIADNPGDQFALFRLHRLDQSTLGEPFPGIESELRLSLRPVGPMKVKPLVEKNGASVPRKIRIFHRPLPSRERKEPKANRGQRGPHNSWQAMTLRDMSLLSPLFANLPMTPRISAGNQKKRADRYGLPSSMIPRERRWVRDQLSPDSPVDGAGGAGFSEASPFSGAVVAGAGSAGAEESSLSRPAALAR